MYIFELPSITRPTYYKIIVAHSRRATSLTMGLHYPTWRQLGLSVAVGYTFLGTFAIVNPTFASELFNLHPKPSTFKPTAAEKGTLSSSRAVAKAHADATSTSMILLGARDLSIGLALLTFYYNEDSKAMGTLILSGMVLCATDVIWIWKLRGWKCGMAFATGALSWAVIGLGLLDCL